MNPRSGLPYLPSFCLQIHKITNKAGHFQANISAVSGASRQIFIKLFVGIDVEELVTRQSRKGSIQKITKHEFE
jgi:hypothetical protein